MKSRHILWILAVFFALCLACGLLLLRTSDSQQVKVMQDGRCLCVLDLDKEQQLTIDAPNGGSNTITIRQGKIAVTAATCPDHVCMSMGYRNGGAPIACLPNGLILVFEESAAVDGMVG